MRKEISLIIIVLLMLSAVQMRVAGKERASNFRATYEMYRLRDQHDYIGAIEKATYLLQQQPKNKLATEFVHDNWQRMMEQVQKTITDNSDMKDIDQSERRTKVYESLTNIEDNLRGVPMPLKGRGWQWQPELLYTQGTYQTERIHLRDLLLTKAKEALRSYDVESAQDIYDRTINSSVLLPEEREGNIEKMRDDCNDLLRQKAERKHSISELLFAYELTTLSLFLDETQEDIPQIQQQIAQDIAACYLEMSERYLQEGDSIKAEQYKQSATDWE